jgi:lysophospholipase L1-like esterase
VNPLLYVLTKSPAQSLPDGSLLWDAGGLQWGGDTLTFPDASIDAPWFLVANEGGSHTFAQPTRVRYGTPRAWVYKTVSGTVTANAATFGTLQPGVNSQLQSNDPSFANALVKVMPIGDSITGFYVQALWNAIGAAGFSAVDFVGNRPYNFNDSYDLDNNGYGGYIVRDVLNPRGSGNKWANSGYLYHGDAGDLEDWTAEQKPDLALIHMGTNDGSSGDVTGVLNAYTAIVAAVRLRNPNVRLFVAQIIPSNSNPSWSTTLNAAIPAWASSLTTVASPITVVDQWTGFNASTMTVDGTHPNATGASHMAAAWMPAISAYLR